MRVGHAVIIYAGERDGVAVEDDVTDGNALKKPSGVDVSDTEDVGVPVTDAEIDILCDADGERLLVRERVAERVGVKLREILTEDDIVGDADTDIELLSDCEDETDGDADTEL